MWRRHVLQVSTCVLCNELMVENGWSFFYDMSLLSNEARLSRVVKILVMDGPEFGGPSVSIMRLWVRKIFRCILLTRVQKVPGLHSVNFIRK